MPVANPAEDSGGTGASGAGALGPNGSELQRLEADRDELLRLLERARADHANGELDDVDADALIDDYTTRAAVVLRRIESLTADRAATGKSTPSRGSGGAGARVDASDGVRSAGGASRASGQWASPRTLVWVVAVVAFALLAGVLVAQSAGRRGAGETFTGDIRQTTRDLLLTARDQTAAGEYDQALATYDEVLAMAPTNAEALTYSAWIGRTVARRIDDEAALVLLEDALASDPSYGDARVFTVIILRDLGRYDEALAELDRLDLDTVPDFMAPQVESLRAEVSGADPDRVTVVRAEAAALRGDYAEAIRLLDEVLVRAPDNAAALIAKADVLLVVASATAGDDRDLLVGNAFNLVERARVVAPLDPTPLLYRALVLELLGRNAEAIETLDLLGPATRNDPELAGNVDQIRQRLTR